MSAATAAGARTMFTLPDDRSATEPPEARGLARDEVRLMVASPADISHARFRDLGRFLAPGDLLVVNTSATLAAAIDGRRGGRRVVVHFSTALERAGVWVVELRAADASGPVRDAAAGETVELRGGARLTLDAPHGGAGSANGIRLWRARVGVEAPVEEYLARYGRPITYRYLRGRWPLADYQTIFGREPGSAEMPSAARPFTHRIVTELVSRGVIVAPVLLHCGVSSLESDEPPEAERFWVPATTARLVNLTRVVGGRVVAVGTTVTRALESAAPSGGAVVESRGWTDLVLGPDRPASVVDGLITGWHGPDASHLKLLEAVAGPELVQNAYDAAVESGYLWHEFGDGCLVLPCRLAR